MARICVVAKGVLTMPYCKQCGQYIGMINATYCSTKCYRGYLQGKHRFQKSNITRRASIWILAKRKHLTNPLRVHLTIKRVKRFHSILLVITNGKSTSNRFCISSYYPNPNNLTSSGKLAAPVKTAPKPISAHLIILISDFTSYFLFMAEKNRC